MRALQIAATGMAAQQTRVEVISQNLANMSTTGYNARRAEFADLAYQQVTRPGTIQASDGTMVPAGVQMGLGVRPTAVTITLAQGALSATGGDLDVAIDGYGYLEVTLPSGTSGYTRDGGLKRSADGQIVTSDGFPVVPDITIPAEARSISISAAGSVTSRAWVSTVSPASSAGSRSVAMTRAPSAAQAMAAARPIPCPAAVIRMVLSFRRIAPSRSIRI